MGGERVDDRLELAEHDFAELVDSEADAVVGEPILGEVVSADLFAAISGAHLLFAFFGEGLVLLFHLDFVETGAEHAHCFLAVLDLRLLVLAAYDGSSRQVRDADRGVSRVDRLPAGSGGAAIRGGGAGLPGTDYEYVLLGVIDAGYRGEILVLMTNLGGPAIELKAGEKIAQMIPVPVLTGTRGEVKSLEDSARAEKGFGSSGR